MATCIRLEAATKSPLSNVVFQKEHVYRDSDFVVCANGSVHLKNYINVNVILLVNDGLIQHNTELKI